MLWTGLHVADDRFLQASSCIDGHRTAAFPSSDCSASSASFAMQKILSGTARQHSADRDSSVLGLCRCRHSNAFNIVLLLASYSAYVLSISVDWLQRSARRWIPCILRKRPDFALHSCFPIQKLRHVKRRFASSAPAARGKDKASTEGASTEPAA